MGPNEGTTEEGRNPFHFNDGLVLGPESPDRVDPDPRSSFPEGLRLFRGVAQASWCGRVLSVAPSTYDPGLRPSE